MRATLRVLSSAMDNLHPVPQAFPGEQHSVGPQQNFLLFTTDGLVGLRRSNDDQIRTLWLNVSGSAFADM